MAQRPPGQGLLLALALSLALWFVIYMSVRGLVS